MMGSNRNRAAVSRGACLVLVFVLAGAAHASAQQDEGTASGPATERAAQAGMFLPYTIAPRTDSQRAFAFVLGGYDTPREHGQLEGTADVTMIGPLAARVGVLYGQSSDRLRPSAGLRVQALSEKSDQGVDLGF